MFPVAPVALSTVPAKFRLMAAKGFRSTESMAVPEALIAPVTARFPAVVVAVILLTVAPLRVKPSVSLRVTSCPETMFTMLRAFAPPSVMSFPAPAVICRVDPTVTTPLWVIAPPEATVRFCPTLPTPRSILDASVTATSFTPELFRLTGPVNSFA